LTRYKENDINRSPNGDDHAGQIGPLKKWPLCVGIAGRFPSEWVAVFIGMRSRADESGPTAAELQLLGVLQSWPGGVANFGL
jgi:hypothetical protein